MVYVRKLGQSNICQFYLRRNCAGNDSTIEIGILSYIGVKSDDIGQIQKNTLAITL